MIPKAKKLSRAISPKKKYDFVSHERMRVRSCLASGDYESLTVNESMRDHIWRGKNCFGDNTRFGFCYSRKIVHRFVDRFLDSRVGYNFDSLYSDICHMFRDNSRDLEHVKYIIFGHIDRDMFRFGIPHHRKYCVVSGILCRT